MSTKRKPIEYVVDENGCHICTSHKRMSINGKSMTVHNYVYRTKVGEIPEGMVVGHKCGTKNCINPSHLILVTSTCYTRHLSYEVDPATGCHNCTSHRLSSSGYPMITVNKKKHLAHRYVYEQSFGEIPEGLVVRHKCDNKRCVNPDHLELGSHADNARDRVERNLQARGSKHGQAKLTEEDVREIRRRLAAGDGVNYLARIYGVNHATISDIKLRKRWRHVD